MELESFREILEVTGAVEGMGRDQALRTALVNTTKYLGRSPEARLSRWDGCTVLTNRKGNGEKVRLEAYWSDPNTIIDMVPKPLIPVLQLSRYNESAPYYSNDTVLGLGYDSATLDEQYNAAFQVFCEFIA